MSWEKNSSFLVLSFLPQSLFLCKKNPSYKTADFAKNPDTQKKVKWNFTVQSSQNPISHNKTDIWSNILCMCIADPVCTPATTENGIFSLPASHGNWRAIIIMWRIWNLMATFQNCIWGSNAVCGVHKCGFAWFESQWTKAKCHPLRKMMKKRILHTKILQQQQNMDLKPMVCCLTHTLLLQCCGWNFSL